MNKFNLNTTKQSKAFEIKRIKIPLLPYGRNQLSTKLWQLFINPISIRSEEAMMFRTRNKLSHFSYMLIVDQGLY